MESESGRLSVAVSQEAGEERRSVIAKMAGLSAAIALALGGGHAASAKSSLERRDVNSSSRSRKASTAGTRGQRPVVQGPCGDGSVKDNTCSENKDCCTNSCDRGINRCRCVRVGGSCTANSMCCTSLVCNEQVCVRTASLVGPAGPPGPVGAPGSVGPQGIQGPPGNSGPMGPDGPAGNTGNAGPQGVPGPQGSQGGAGSVGPAGSSGAQGSSGPAGPAGPQGSDGSPGPAGSQGPAGPQGANGPQGEPGAPAPAPQYVQSTPVDLAADDTGFAQATCLAGQEALGGGYVVTAGSLTSIDRDGFSGTTGWRVRATAGPDGATLVVTVVCVEV